MLYRALLNADEALMRALARQAVRRFAGHGAGPAVGGTYYLYRTLRNLDLEGVLEAHDWRRPPGLADGSPLEERLERDEYQIRIDQLKKEIEAEIRRRLVADRGRRGHGHTLRKPLPEDVDFMHATREEMASLPQGHLPRSPASWPCAWPASAATAARARSTSAAPCATRCPTAACPPSQVQVPAAVQARDLRDRRHLRLGGRLRPLHPAPRVRHLQPVLQGPGLRVHRRHRRGHPLLRGRRRTSPRPSTGSTPRPTSSGSTATPTTGTPSRCSGRSGARRSPPRPR